MKIGLDLREKISKNTKINNDIINIIIEKLAEKSDILFNIYLNKKSTIKEENKENLDFYEINFETISVKNQVNFRNILKEHLNDLNIFFGLGRPILHKSEDILIINNLNNLLYETTDVNTFTKKYKYHFFLEHSSLYSKKIVTFLDNNKHTLNEKLNISEEKINNVYPFFYKKDFSKYDGKLNIFCKNKFVIYNSGSGKENIKIFFEAIYNYNQKNSEKLDIVFIGEEYNDVEIRKLALEYDLIGNIKNIDDEDKEIYSYYKNASFIIYPTFYDVFPFELNNALNIGTPILAGETPAIKEIFSDSLTYFKPNSLLSLEENIEKLVKNEAKFNYSKVFEKYSPENFINNLVKLFPEKK